MSRNLNHIISTRVDDALLTEIKALASEDGQSVGDWIRNACWREVWHRQVPATPPPAPRICGWSCPHMSMTSIPGVLRNVKSWCGCDMKPIYEHAA